VIHDVLRDTRQESGNELRPGILSQDFFDSEECTECRHVGEEMVEDIEDGPEPAVPRPARNAERLAHSGCGGAD